MRIGSVACIARLPSSLSSSLPNRSSSVLDPNMSSIESTLSLARRCLSLEANTRPGRTRAEPLTWASPVCPQPLTESVQSPEREKATRRLLAGGRACHPRRLWREPVEMMQAEQCMTHASAPENQCVLQARPDATGFQNLRWHPLIGLVSLREADRVERSMNDGLSRINHIHRSRLTWMVFPVPFVHRV